MGIKIKDAEGVEHELLTKEEQAEMITGAVKAHTKNLSTDLTKKLGDLLTAGLGETMTAFEAKVDAKLQESAKPVPPKPGEAPPQVDIESHPAFKGMQKQLADATKKIAEAETATQAERAKAKDAALRTTLQEKLIKSGIDPKRAHLALGVLVDAQKRVRYADDDSIIFRGDDNEDVDLETGLKAWTQTEDAKTFTPPRGTGGSGTIPGNKTTPITTTPGKVQPGTLGRMVLDLASSNQSGGLPSE